MPAKSTSRPYSHWNRGSTVGLGRWRITWPSPHTTSSTRLRSLRMLERTCWPASRESSRATSRSTNFGSEPAAPTTGPSECYSSEASARATLETPRLRAGPGSGAIRCFTRWRPNRNGAPTSHGSKSGHRACSRPYALDRVRTLPNRCTAALRSLAVVDRKAVRSAPAPAARPTATGRSRPSRQIGHHPQTS